MQILESLYNEFYKTLIAEGRWRLYVSGFGNTMAMTLIAMAIGVVLGVLVAIVKTYNKQTGRLKPLNWFCNLYTTVIRGTPVMVQLLIFYYVVFVSAPTSLKLFIASLAFGVNSGAYVSEIIRAGIQSVDEGQGEAGRSLGLTQGQTMRLIILPQAVKNILPTLFNELIMLVKETSVASYIGLMEITRAGDLIRSRTFGFMPLFITAAIYLVVVVALTKVQQKMEKRLAASDRG